MLGLKEAVYRQYEPDNFVRTWLEDNGVDTAILNDFRSAMKLDELVKRDIVTVGDELYLQDSNAKVATVSCLIALSPLLTTPRSYT